MFLLPSEQKFVEIVQQRSIELKRLNAAPNRQLTIQPTLQKLNAENNDLMHLAKRAIVSYLKCVYLMKDKTVFRLNEIDAQKLSESYGLITTPQINFKVQEGEVPITNTMSRAEMRAARVQMLREKAKSRKNQKQQEQQKQIWDQVSEGESLDEDEGQKMKPESQPDEISSSQSDSDANNQEVSDDSDDLLVPAKTQRKLSEEKEEAAQPAKLIASKKKLKKITTEGPYGGKNRMLLDAEGKPMDEEKMQQERQKELAVSLQIENEAEAKKKSGKEYESYIDRVKRKMKETQEQDTKLHKDRLKEKRKKLKRKHKDHYNDYGDEEQGVQLASNSEVSQQSQHSDIDSVGEPEPPKKKQKISQDLNAEQRALKLLDEEF